MRIFITGATGYIGHQLVKKLLQQEVQLHLLVRNPFSTALPVHKNISIFKGDILNKKDLAEAMYGCSHVFHCAAIARMEIKDKDKFFNVNVTGTQNVLDAALGAGVEKLVFTSSAAVFGPSLKIPLSEDDPRIEAFESDYDFSKHLAENLVREYAKKGLYAVIVNPSRVYGPGLSTYSNAITRFIDRFITHRLMIIPDIMQYKGNYTFIDDVIDGHLKAMENGVSGENYILGGENVSYESLTSTIKKYAGRSARIVCCPAAFLKIILSVISPFYRHMDINPEMISRLKKHRMVSSEKAITQLGYCITPFEKGMEETIHNLKNTHL